MGGLKEGEAGGEGVDIRVGDDMVTTGWVVGPSITGIF